MADQRAVSPLVLRWFGAKQLQWSFYDHTGALIREVVEEEVPAERLGPVVDVPGGMLMADPRGGWYAARWPTKA